MTASLKYPHFQTPSFQAPLMNAIYMWRLQPDLDIQKELVATYLGRNCVSIIFVMSGGGRCQQRNQVLQLEACTVYVGFGACFHDFELPQESIGHFLLINLQHSLISFDILTFFYETLFAGGPQRFNLAPDIAEEIYWVMTRIQNDITSKDQFRLDLVQKYLSIFLVYLRSHSQREKVAISMSRRGMLVRSFFSLLEENFKVAKTVDYYAGKLCVSAKHLSNVIKTASGIPTSYHINQRIVLEAKRMAQASDACLKEIAYHLGYEDVSAFSKMFKRVSGETFSDYRGSLEMELSNITTKRRSGNNDNNPGSIAVSRSSVPN
ncbi:MAG: AraC family transcriptional regulator [Chitinophaga sp.]|uniref:helix-turn-helix domain-containing protein n=1 Tax=Chitinophaga sp. TaxID=1869181 RepID=UPI0025B7FE46|nr:helix-turn-helix transcriptional regulator [Chitinophaga sp.]MBV8252285.1 AraC family transcriptional regulator [Chitinophaga sp.]